MTFAGIGCRQMQQIAKTLRPDPMVLPMMRQSIEFQWKIRFANPPAPAPRASGLL